MLDLQVTLDILSSLVQRDLSKYTYRTGDSQNFDKQNLDKLAFI
ncbi:26002_t:CDS:1, partial [Gigaspora margarita]